MELKKYKLGDCLTMIENGAVIKQKKNAGGIPITRIETLSNDRFNRDRLGYADIFDESSYSHFILDDMDLIMSHINSRTFLGRTVIYRKHGDEKIIHGMNVLRLKTDIKVLNPLYAYYYFKTNGFRTAIDHIRKDAINQSSLATSDIKNLEILIPSIEEQSVIVSILDNLDRKIALNCAINQNLEALAKQLYDYWFVQFDFPDENGRPYKSSGGKMVWNEKIKREIPVKWEVKSLSSVAIVNQKSLSKEDILTEIEYLDTSSLTENNITETQQIFKEEAPSRAQRKVKQRTILYSTVRPRLKHYGILCNPASNLIVSTGFATIDALDIRLAYYIYYVLTQKSITEYLGSIADTAVSSYPSINPTDLESINVVIPDERLIKAFDETISPLYELKEDSAKTIQTLIKQRDELLPLLMNGQVSLNSDLSND